MKLIWCQLYYKRRSMHSNNYKTITFSLPLLNVVFLQTGLEEICCFIECHPTCQFRILFLPVLTSFIAVCVHKNEANPNAKQLTIIIIHALHSPTVSWIQIHRETWNSEFLLNVNNNLEKCTNLSQAPWFLFDLI